MIFELILLTPTAFDTTYLFSPVSSVTPVSVGITILETKSPTKIVSKFLPKDPLVPDVATFNCYLNLSSDGAPNLNPSTTCGGGASWFVNPSKYNRVEFPLEIVLLTSSDR